MTGSKANIGSDLIKVDAYLNKEADYDELPELNDAFFEKARPMIDGKPIGRPPLGDRPKVQLTLRLDAHAVELFRASGPGWQRRMNASLQASPIVWKMIIEQEGFIVDMELMLDHLRSGDIRSMTEPATASVNTVERRIRNVKETVHRLRNILIAGGHAGTTADLIAGEATPTD